MTMRVDEAEDDDFSVERNSLGAGGDGCATRRANGGNASVAHDDDAGGQWRRTGAVDVPHVGEGQDKADADALYTLLESDVIPLFFRRDENGLPRAWLERVRASIIRNVPFFNTHRMVGDYTRDAYLPAHRANGKSSERIA